MYFTLAKTVAPMFFPIFKGSSSHNVNMEPSKETISNLKFIGQLNKGDKINTKFLYRQPDGLRTRIERTFVNYDNRQNALNFVYRTIHSVFDLIGQYQRSGRPSDKQMVAHMVKDLTLARTGLLNLKETYSEDLRFKCDMDTLLEEVEAKMGEIELDDLPVLDNRRYSE